MKKLLLGLIACLSFSANASLIAESNYVVDTAQGLDWLRWDETNNRSYNDVASNFGIGGDFEGWTYATASQAETFLANFGFSNYSTTAQRSSEDSFNELTGLMGIESTSTQSWIYGMVETSGTKATTYSHYFYSWMSVPEFKIFNLNKTYTAGFLGSFLVRDTSYVPPTTSPMILPISNPTQVSEPATAMLMLLTLGGLFGLKRLRK